MASSFAGTAVTFFTKMAEIPFASSNFILPININYALISTVAIRTELVHQINVNLPPALTTKDSIFYVELSNN